MGKKKRYTYNLKEKEEDLLSPTEFEILVANCMADKDQNERLNSARQFIHDLRFISRLAKRSGNMRLLQAIQKAKKKGELSVDSVIHELRRLRYAYNGNPDRISVISIPMGGKTK